MYACMLFQRTLVTECLITNITSIRTVTTMYASMSYQMALMIEFLITYFTNIRTLIFRCARCFIRLLC
jgi:hypothetical protein